MVEEALLVAKIDVTEKYVHTSCIHTVNTSPSADTTDQGATLSCSSFYDRDINNCQIKGRNVRYCIELLHTSSVVYLYLVVML